MRHDAGADPVSAGAVPLCRDVADLVLGVAGVPSRRARLTGLGAGLAAGLGAWLALFGLLRPPRPSSPVRPLPSRTFELALEDVPPSIRPPHAPPTAPAVSSRSPPHVASPATTRSNARTRPVELAQAARALTTEPRADEPVDLTADGLVVGAARPYAGGSTSAAGTRSSSGPGRAVPGEPAPGSPGQKRPDASRPVSLAGESWSCPWPTEAEPLAIDEQAVLIRVVARSDGSVEAVTVQSDPGHGFGDGAADCARRARFVPARNSNGEPVRATSPPIRVRFSR